MENRILKFRAWDKTEKAMFNVMELDFAFNIEKYNVTSHAVLDGRWGRARVTPNNGKQFYSWTGQKREAEQIELMQFTGLHDKNGKEIYENDVVRLDSWEPKEMQIAFIEGAFCLANKNGEFLGDIHYIHHAGIKQAEVVGNIYEDKNLLK